MTFCTSRSSVATLYRLGGQIYNLLVYNSLEISLTKNHINRVVFDVTLTSQPSWKLKSMFVQLQNLFFEFTFPSFTSPTSESESECKCLTCIQKPTGSQFSLLHEPK